MFKIQMFYIMKKLFLMAILATGTLAMSSCSNEDELASSGQVSTLDPNVVAFRTNGQKGMTRSGATVTSLTTFNVWSSTADGNAYIGALDGSGEAFTYDALSEVFKSDVNHYWPSVGTLNFFASNVFTQMDGYHSDQTPHDAVVEYTNDGSKDIVCATVRTGTKTIPYPLLFHHVLSQVKVTAEAKDKTQDLQYRIVGITMTTQDDGKYHYATSTAGIGTWELNDEESTRAYAFGANMPSVFEKDGRFASTDYWNVLPCVNDIVFSIQYQVIQNGVVISDFTGANAKTVTVSSPGLLSEKKYTYNFKLGIDNDDVITLDPGISDWDDEDPIDLDVPLDLSFSLTPKKMNFTVLRSTQDLTATVYPLTVSQDVTFSSNDPKIATVSSDGIVTAYCDGVCKVTATSVLDPTLKDTCSVTVTPPRTATKGGCYDFDVLEGNDQAVIFDNITPMIRLRGDDYPYPDDIRIEYTISNERCQAYCYIDADGDDCEYAPDGNIVTWERWQRISTIPVYGEDGKPLSVVGSIYNLPRFHSNDCFYIYNNPAKNKSTIMFIMSPSSSADAFTICPAKLYINHTEVVFQ